MGPDDRDLTASDGADGADGNGCVEVAGLGRATVAVSRVVVG